MYDRTHNQEELTFVVSGMLWQQSLVMMDRETKSLWSHLLGKCMSGDLKDTELKMLPARLTDWETWRKSHPETTVMLMRRIANGFTREMYRDLQHFVAGMSKGGKSKAWSFEDLAQHPLINDVFMDDSILIAFDRWAATPFVFDRLVDGSC